MTTVREWLFSSSLDSIDKSFMLEHVCGMDKAAQLIHDDRVLSSDEERKLNDIAKKRSEIHHGQGRNIMSADMSVQSGIFPVGIAWGFRR